MNLAEHDPLDIVTGNTILQKQINDYEASRPRCPICRKALGFDRQAKPFAICAHKDIGATP